MTDNIKNCSADEAKSRLIEGNRKFVTDDHYNADISKQKLQTLKKGQNPYAVIITCSDSRVIPELIFSAEFGELFVIRIAGNVIDSHQLGSIEYASEHLGTKLIVVLGHTNCGAVGAVLGGETHGYIRYIADSIRGAIGTETNEYKACCLNVKHSCKMIEESLKIQKEEAEKGLKVTGAVYDIETGQVEFI